MLERDSGEGDPQQLPTVMALSAGGYPDASTKW